MAVQETRSRLARRVMRPSAYDFEIIKKSGKAKGNADALLRMIYSPDLEGYEGIIIPLFEMIQK